MHGSSAVKDAVRPIHSLKLSIGAEIAMGLLEVQHNMDVLKQRNAADWKSLFEKRYRRTQYPYGSGCLGKKGTRLPKH